MACPSSSRHAFSPARLAILEQLASQAAISIENARLHEDVQRARTELRRANEELEQHGFTTRKGGHGFGLHSSALAAQLLDGRLTIESEGPGKGAVTTLTLRMERQEFALLE